MIFGGFSCLCYDIEVTIAIFTCGRQWALNYWRTIGSWPDHTDVVDKRISTRLCARLPANYCTMRYAPELYLYSYCESRYNCGAYLVVQLINFVYRVSIGMHKATWLTCNVHASLASACFVGHVNLQYLMQNKQVLFGQNTKLNAIFVFSYNVHEHALRPPGFTERTCFLVCQV